MNYLLFCEAFCNAIEIVETTNIPNIKSKKKKLIDSFCNTVKKADCYNQEFHSICHELEVFNYLSKINYNPIPSDDSKPGADFNADIGFIECISATMGDEKTKQELINKRKDYDKFAVHHVSQSWPAIIESRFTSVIKDKKDKFSDYIKANVIDKKSPCIICVSSTAFIWNTHSEDFEIMFKKILYGIDYLQTMVFSTKNSSKPEYIETINAFNDICKKGDVVRFQTGYFNLKEYKNISAVILVNRPIAEQIDKEKFIFYLNYNANNKIDVVKLNDVIYFSFDGIINNKRQFSYKNRK